MTDNLVREFVRLRVPQMLFICLGTSWAVIEFLGTLVDRYLLPLHVVELSLILLAWLILTERVIDILEHVFLSRRWEPTWGRRRVFTR